ncbi:unnamed protein product [Caenorhabditis sp. 36 PRJEB53466]|nr:unnamed protein product [Caenorhabditis sp. 36 PRJEB53466]
MEQIGCAGEETMRERTKASEDEEEEEEDQFYHETHRKSSQLAAFFVRIRLRARRCSVERVWNSDSAQSTEHRTIDSARLPRSKIMKEVAQKIGIRKSLNRFMRELTDDGKLDFESVSFQVLELEAGKRDNECADIIEVLLETASRSGCPDRLLILQLIDRFFLQFVHFRNEILNDPTEFLELMVELNPIRNPLPGSKKNGKELKTEAIRAIREWEKQFAKDDARMKCLAVTLKKTKFVEYEQVIVDLEAERERKAKIAERKMRMMQSALVAYERKFQKIKEDADRLSIEMDTALRILVPSFTEDNVDPNVPGTSTLATPSSSSKTLDIFIPDLAPEVIVSSENDAVVEAFLDVKTLLIHRVQTLRKLAKRLLVLKQHGQPLADKIVTYRDSLKKRVLKAEELKIKGDPRETETKKKKKFDDGFIDVEISIDDILMLQYSKKTEEAMEKEKVQKKMKGETKTIEKPRETVKAVPFGLDLKYWGEDREKVEVPKNNADCHRFWRSADEGTVAGTAHHSIYTQRQFTFVGKAAKSDKVCRATLPNGALCPRRDFLSCPLHGKIVDRDEKGEPIAEEDRRTERKREERKRQKESEEFSRKIEKEYEQKTKRKKKHDVETTHSEDVRSRLQKKLLDPKTVQRVSAVLDAAQKNRLQKNFGHQFSHM